MTMTRRSVIAAAPSALALPCLPASAGGADPIFAAFAAWLDAARDLESTLTGTDGEGPAAVSAHDREETARLRLAETRAATPEGLALQVRAAMFCALDPKAEAMRDPYRATPDQFHGSGRGAREAFASLLAAVGAVGGQG